MKRLTLLLFIVLNIYSLSAQKRNTLSTGLFFDYLLKVKGESNDDGLSFANKTGCSVGYERLLGKRVSVGLRLVKFFGTGSDGTSFSTEFSNDELLNPPSGYSVRGAFFVEKGYGFAYESRFYFEEFDHDGPNSPYLGVVASRLKFKEGYTSIYVDTYGTPTEPFNFDYENQYSIYRVGIQYGYLSADNFLSDWYIGCFYNHTSGKEREFNTPTSLANFSFNFGCRIGFSY